MTYSRVNRHLLTLTVLRVGLVLNGIQIFSENCNSYSVSFAVFSFSFSLENLTKSSSECQQTVDHKYMIYFLR